VTATEFVTHLGRISGLPPTVAKERAAESLRHVGLHEERYRLIGTYSTGMKQRVKLAQALVGAPRLMLLDEPTNGLDPAGRTAMLELIGRIGRSSASPSSSPHTCSARSSGSATTWSRSTAGGCCAPTRSPASPRRARSSRSKWRRA
jgi:ABC-type multidrug transport system, ATPase component